MNSFLSCFLADLFNRILEQSSLVYMGHKIETQILESCQKITAFGNILSDLRTDSAYHHFFQSTVSLIGKPSSNVDKRHNHESLYFEVVDNSISMLTERFADCNKFAFLDLVNSCIFTQCRKGVPPDMLQY